mmetsp:Transcript_11382/g.36108  ORF Transcript_11382/g.36108 Transcript_11382/m.36108 type:complete len:217 (-) Transcript_11382:138-788(-)
MSAAHRPSMLRPRAGSAAVALASTAPPTDIRAAVRSRTNCDGTTIRSSPPFFPPQPPVSVRASSPERRASSKNRRVTQSAAATREALLAAAASPSAAFAPVTTTRTRLGAAYASRWTRSMITSPSPRRHDHDVRSISRYAPYPAPSSECSFPRNSPMSRAGPYGTRIDPDAVNNASTRSSHSSPRDSACGGCCCCCWDSSSGRPRPRDRPPPYLAL